MEDPNILYIQFDETQIMYDVLINLPTKNHVHGLGHKGSTIFFSDGIRRSRKLLSTDATERSSNTHKIEKRNERERYRVQAVNDAFCRLRRLIPTIAARRKRISKVKTLKKALQYIMQLQTILKS